MDTKKLRQKVLNLAIRGKLIPQDPNDEPASELVAKIRNEKERLIKEKKIKRDKNDSFLFRGDDKSYYENRGGVIRCIASEIPFEIPESWAWVRLSDICLMKAGSFVPASDIEATFIDGLYPCFGGNGLRGYTSTFTHEGTYPLIGRQGALCGNINLVDGKFYATEHAIVVMPTPLIDVYWLRYLLQGLNLNEYAAGAAQPGLSVEKLTKLKLALPPYEEQIRIANILQASFHITEDVRM